MGTAGVNKHMLNSSARLALGQHHCLAALLAATPNQAPQTHRLR